MSQPEIIDNRTSYTFKWKDEQLQVVVTRLHEHRDGHISCELDWTTTNPQYHTHLLRTSFNLSSSLTKSNLIKQLAEAYKEKVDWNATVEQLRVITVDRMRAGEPIQELWTDDKIAPPEYKLYPILPEGEPTMLYADGGSGKTYVSLYIAMCIQLPWIENPLRFKPKFGKVLVLDYEAGGNTATLRLKRIKMGHDLPEFMVEYRRCEIPLEKEVDRIVSYIKEREIDTVIIDSVFGASAGGLNDDGVAKGFFQAVRGLPTTTLILHHVAKGIKKTDDKTAYGSAFFKNAVRMSWELISESGKGEPTLKLGLFNRKSNNARLHNPIGIEIEFDDPYGPVSFHPYDVEGDGSDVIQQSLPLGKRIINALKHGPMITSDIAKEVGSSYHQVAARLNEMKKANKALRLPDSRWGLISDNQ